MPDQPPSSAWVTAGTVFNVGWSYDESYDYLQLKALKDFDLRAISTQLMQGYAPRTTIRQHFDHLAVVLVRDGYATTEVNTASFTYQGAESDDALDLIGSADRGAAFYKPHRR